MSNLKVTASASVTLAIGVFLFCWTALHVGPTLSLIGSSSPDLAELARVQILVELVELTIAGTLMLLAFRLLVGGQRQAERVTARRGR